MKEQKDEKWLDETISRAVDLGQLDFDKEKWRQKYILKKSDEATSSYVKVKPNYNIWRFIMESKVTKYSAAAVVALAAALVLLSPFGIPGNSGVVLADVQQKVADIETMIIRGTKTFTHPGKDGDVFELNGVKFEFDLVKYLSKQYGLVEEGYIGDELIYRFTFNRPKRQTLLVIPPYKKYGMFTSTDKQMQLLENGTPKGIVNLLLEGGYSELGRDNIDGVDVEGFEFQDPATFKGLLPKAICDIQSLKGKVWIGLKEQLPIWVEGDIVIGKSLVTGFNDLTIHEFNILEKYNVELDEAVFDTNAPEGYTEFTLNDILTLIPIEAKAGLVGLGASSCVIPAGFIVWKKHRKKKTMANQR
ncbi:MAG: hypothetical protein PHY02_10230 [Phycisphaerae bacterium]|nr:hypothetical protein [Phycisphaerae bacterium]